MSPNAISNSRSQQMAQLEALLSSSSAKLKVTEECRTHLQKAVAAIDSIGKIPQLTDVHKIGAAIKHLAMAQVVQAELNITVFTTEVETINNAIATANSPIARVSIGG
jgi:hypothetical protein